MANEYPLGSVVRCSVAFTDSNNLAVDPGTVSFIYMQPDNTKTTLVYPTDAALVKDSTGNYHVDVDSSAAPGVWYYRFKGTGINQAANETFFKIQHAQTY